MKDMNLILHDFKTLADVLLRVKKDLINVEKGLNQLYRDLEIHINARE